MAKITKTLRATAYHEAGHAVAAYVQHRRFSLISIEPDQDSFGRIVFGQLGSLLRADVSTDARTKRDLERRVIVLLAGHVAERHLVGRNSWVGSSQDFQRALGCLDYLHGDNAVVSAHADYLWVRTRSIITSPQNWSAVEALAAALLDKRRIGRHKAREIIATAIEQALTANLE